MDAAFNTLIWLNGRIFDIAEHNNVRRLLVSRRGRRAIAKWLNNHKASPDYEKVYSVVSGLTNAGGISVESLIATATITTCVLSPVLSSSQINKAGYAPICKVCHVSENEINGNAKKRIVKIPVEKKPAAVDKEGVPQAHARKASIDRDIKQLTFVNLGTVGSGVKSIGEVYEVEEGGEGRVGTAKLLFRDGKGMRLISELGKYPPMGAEVVFGSKAYQMLKNGIEWNMRNIVSINGIPADRDVFIAEYFVKKQDNKESSYQVQNKKALIKEIQERYASYLTEKSGNSLQETAIRETGNTDANTALTKTAVKKNEDALQTEKPALRDVQDNKPEYAFYQAKESEGFIEKEVKGLVENMVDNRVLTSEKSDSYEVTLHFGGLAVSHVFKRDSNATIHEAFLKAYPKISLREVVNVPLEEIKENISRYLRGKDGQLEANMLFLVTKELRTMLGNSVVRQLPAPDDCFVTDVKIMSEGDYYFKYIYIHMYYGFDSGRWVALDDELLSKLVQSEPIPLYTKISASR